MCYSYNYLSLYIYIYICLCIFIYNYLYLYYPKLRSSGVCVLCGLEARFDLEGTKGTLGRGTVQKIGVRYISSCFKPHRFRPFAKRPFAKRPFGPLRLITAGFRDTLPFGAMSEANGKLQQENRQLNNESKQYIYIYIYTYTYTYVYIYIICVYIYIYIYICRERDVWGLHGVSSGVVGSEPDHKASGLT